MKRAFRLAALAVVTLLFSCIVPAFSQGIPLGGVGALQFWDNQNNLLTSGAVYVYAAGTSTQIASYTDATLLFQNSNPVTFGNGARASIWFPAGIFVKVVLCAVATDGPTCAAGDTLFVADQVPINSGGSSGSCGAGCTGFFISSTASPATTGILRLASGDTLCFRNNAGSANLCMSKNANDLLGWAGGSLLLPEVGVPSGIVGSDLLWADNSAHRWRFVNNGGSADTFVGLATTDTLTNKTLTSPTINSGALATPTITTPTVNSGIAHGGTGFQHIRFTSCTITCSGTASWPTSFADTNYTVLCSALAQSGTNSNVASPFNKTTSGFSYAITAVSGSTAGGTEVDCIGVHD